MKHIAMLLLFLLAFNTYAGSKYIRQLTREYPYLTTTPLTKCTICHIKPGYRTFNYFSNDFTDSGNSYKLIEELDSDDDGFTNLEEIMALTFPGDPLSYPEVIDEL